MKLRILNLYAGIGGNRKLWGDEHEITAVEYKPKIAAAYQKFFPRDKVVVADAHEYLLEHYAEFDFIWSSPPCPTHSRWGYLRMLPGENKTTETKSEIRYPDMTLYQEIIFLTHFFKGKWSVENVVSYYDPLIPPNKIGGHYIWSNFPILPLGGERQMGRKDSARVHSEKTGFDLSGFVFAPNEKRKLLRNCVEPIVGKHILDCAIKSPSLFAAEEKIKVASMF